MQGEVRSGRVWYGFWYDKVRSGTVWCGLVRRGEVWTVERRGAAR